MTREKKIIHDYMLSLDMGFFSHTINKDNSSVFIFIKPPKEIHKPNCIGSFSAILDEEFMKLLTEENKKWFISNIEWNAAPGLRLAPVPQKVTKGFNPG